MTRTFKIIQALKKLSRSSPFARTQDVATDIATLDTDLNKAIKNETTPTGDVIQTYAEMLTYCTGTAVKFFFVAKSEKNSGEPAQYIYDGRGGVWWIAAARMN